MQAIETIDDFMGSDERNDLISGLVQLGREAHASAEDGLDPASGARLGTYGYVTHDYRGAIIRGLKSTRLAGLQRKTSGRVGLVSPDLHLYLVGLRPSGNRQLSLPNNPKRWPPTHRSQLELTDIGRVPEDIRTAVFFLTFIRDQEGILEEVTLCRPKINPDGTVLEYLESRVLWSRSDSAEEEHEEREIKLNFPSLDSDFAAPDSDASNSEAKSDSSS